MEFKGSTVKDLHPLPDQGVIRLEKTKQKGSYRWTWQNKTTGQIEQDMNIVQKSVQFKKLNQVKGTRTFSLEFLDKANEPSLAFINILELLNYESNNSTKNTDDINIFTDNSELTNNGSQPSMYCYWIQDDNTEDLALLHIVNFYLGRHINEEEEEEEELDHKSHYLTSNVDFNDKTLTTSVATPRPSKKQCHSHNNIKDNLVATTESSSDSEHEEESDDIVQDSSNKQNPTIIKTNESKIVPIEVGASDESVLETLDRAEEDYNFLKDYYYPARVDKRHFYTQTGSTSPPLILATDLVVIKEEQSVQIPMPPYSPNSTREHCLELLMNSLRRNYKDSAIPLDSVEQIAREVEIECFEQSNCIKSVYKSTVLSRTREIDAKTACNEHYYF